MIDDVTAIVPTAAATVAAEPSLGEATLPAPTAQQMDTADRVFSDSPPPHPLATLFVVAASVGLLRDVAIDTFDTTGADDDETEEQTDDA